MSKYELNITTYHYITTLHYYTTTHYLTMKLLLELPQGGPARVGRDSQQPAAAASTTCACEGEQVCYAGRQGAVHATNHLAVP